MPLADASLAMAMVAAGADHLIGLRAGARPELSRTATVAIACLLLTRHSLTDATARARAVRPRALPAAGLWHPQARIAPRLGR